MHDFLSRAAADFPDHLAVDDGAGEWSYRELDRACDRAAGALASVLPPGRRVALLMDNGVPLLAAIHAVPRIGCTLAPLSPKLTHFELADALRALEAAVVLTTAEHVSLARAAAARGDVDVPVLDAAAFLPIGGAHAPSPPRSSPNGAAREWAVLWTSGTSGRPRGVALSAENLSASAAASRDRLGLGSADRWYLGLSCAHVGGLAMVVRAALLGSALVVRGAFDARVFSELMDGGRVTHASLVPTMLQRVLDVRGDRAAPRSLRCVLVGGARAPHALVERALAAGFPVALTYGMTEASSQVATAPPEMVRSKPDAAGAPLPGVEVRVDGAGEVLVRGPTVALTYVGTSEPLTDAKGWLHTGDLGELDRDGHLRVTGRRSDRIVTGGVNVDPAEVEDILRSHPGVQDVSVVGLPDPEWGEVVAAAAVRTPGVYPDPAELETLARSRLTSSKIPRRIVFVEDLPRNANGKVDREAVRASFVGGGSMGTQLVD
jgi:O-succinylbenzoic acid--CoA ligase